MMMSVSVPVTNPRLGEEEHAVGDVERIGGEDRDLREDRVGGLLRQGFHNGPADEGRVDSAHVNVGLGNVQRDLLRDRAHSILNRRVRRSATADPAQETGCRRDLDDRTRAVLLDLGIAASSGVPRTLTLRIRIVSSASMSHISRVWPVLIWGVHPAGRLSGL